MPIPVYLHHIPSLLNEIPLDQARLLLDQDERALTAKIKAERRLHEFIYGRYLLKSSLALQLNQPVNTIKLAKHAHGKLYLSGNPTYFNLSHSGDYLAYALYDHAEIGLDIEHSGGRMSDMLSVASRYFTAQESHALQQCCEFNRDETFYRIWTLKEAALKTVGVGISAGLECLNTHQMDLSEAQILEIKDKKHHLWFNFWQEPLGFSSVYLSVAVECGATDNIGSAHSTPPPSRKPMFELTSVIRGKNE
jgi:4'-phosphopantetheinyl transferase